MLARFFRRKVEREDTIHPSGLGALGIGLATLSEDKIIIGVENDGDLAEPADSTDQIKHALTVTAALECSLRGQLIGEPVCERIRKGHTKL